MNKKLFTQILGEWRSNTWLAVELLVVSTIIWILVDGLYYDWQVWRQPMGFDTSHCYKLKMGLIGESSPEYKPYNSDKERYRDVQEMAERLRHYDGVEAAALSCAAHPYNGSNSTMPLRTDTVSITPWYRMGQADMLKVFRWHGANGESPEELAAKLTVSGQMLASADLLDKAYGLDINQFVGHDFVAPPDTVDHYPLVGVYQPVRISNFYLARLTPSVFFLTGQFDYYNELCVRVKPEADHDFAARLMHDKEKLFRIGNIFIVRVSSFDDIREGFMRSDITEERNKAAICIFLMLNVFLGLFGTFWFRTQQRRSEIALHKAVGATNRAVFLRLVSEGACLLLMVMPLSVLIFSLIGYYELIPDVTFKPQLFITFFLTQALVLTMIVLGILFPARRAMKINPAEALKEE